MYSKGKYIVGELRQDFGLGIISAVVFNEVVQHSTFKNLFHEIYGAGFFQVTTDGLGDRVVVGVYGGSVSLSVDSRGEADVKEIRRALGLEYQ